MAERAAATGAAVGGISPARKAVAIALLAFLGFAHVYVVGRKVELWPLSHYPMYSRVYGTTWTTHEFVGVAADGSGREVAIPVQWFPRPISVVGSLDTIVPAVVRGERDAADLDEPLRWVATQYERRAARTRGGLPPITGVRLYQNSWELRRENGRIEILDPVRELRRETLVGGVTP